MTLTTPKEQAATDLAARYSTDLPWVEDIIYTPVDGQDEEIPAIVDRQRNLEPYVRGPETATVAISVRVSDVPFPQHGDRFTITNPQDEDEVWEFREELDSTLLERTLMLERELA